MLSQFRRREGPSSAAGLLGPLCLLLQAPQRIPRIYAFLEVLDKETAESAETFVLRDVSQFVDQQTAVSPPARLNEDAVAQRHPDSLRGNKPQLCANGPQEVICRRDDLHSQQPDLFGMDNTDLPSRACLSRRKCDPSPQNDGLVPGRPEARNRNSCCDDKSRHDRLHQNKRPRRARFALSC